MSWRAETGETKDGTPYVALLDGDAPVLKAYPSPDGAQIRIVLPELSALGQIRQFPSYENHYVTFHRKPKRRTR